MNVTLYREPLRSPLPSGNCYDKVRKETNAMRESMREDVRLYDAPRTEVPVAPMCH